MDTNTQNCKQCGQEKDCIGGYCSECANRGGEIRFLMNTEFAGIERLKEIKMIIQKHIPFEVLGEAEFQEYKEDLMFQEVTYFEYLKYFIENKIIPTVLKNMLLKDDQPKQHSVSKAYNGLIRQKAKELYNVDLWNN